MNSSRITPETLMNSSRITPETHGKKKINKLENANL